jgi:hypothetical protein
MAPPVLNMKPLKNNATSQVMFADDPMFNIDAGLLPPTTDLDFLTVDNAAHTADNERRLGIQRDDRDNDVAYMPLTQDDTVFDDGLAAPDELQDVNPEFAFNDDGFLMDLNTVDANATTNIAAELNDGLDFDFQLDLDRNNRATSFQDPDMDQILEEVAEPRVPGKNAEVVIPAKLAKRKRVRAEYSEVTIDAMISLSTDQLRQFRDEYVDLMKSKAKKQKSVKPDIGSLIHDPFLPCIAKITPAIEMRRGRTEVREEEEDFIDGLIRHRRSSISSVESGRNASQTRRHSRGSITGFNLPIDDAPMIDDFVDNDMDFVLDLDDNTNGSSKKRSSSVSSRLPGLHEDEVLDFDIYLGQNSRKEGSQEPRHDDNHLSAKGNGKTLRFLKFLESRFEEEQTTRMTFAHFLNYQQDRSIVVKSFYEVLQLTTLGEISVSITTTENFDLLTAGDFSIRLA